MTRCLEPPISIMRKDVYLVITRDNSYFLKVLPCFIKFDDYGEYEKIKYPHDVGKIETHLCVFRICYYNNVHFKISEKERFFLEKPADEDLVPVSKEDIFSRLQQIADANEAKAKADLTN